MTRDRTELKPQGHSPDPGELQSLASESSSQVENRLGQRNNTGAERKIPFLTEAKACVFKDTGNKGAKGSTQKGKG